MNTKAYWIAFGIGVAAGATVALLYAPQTGERTRKKLGRAYDEATDYFEDAGDYLKDQAERLAKRSKKIYAEGADAVADTLESTAATYDKSAKGAAYAYGVASDRVEEALSSVRDKATDLGSYTTAYGKKIRSMV